MMYACDVYVRSMDLPASSDGNKWHWLKWPPYFVPDVLAASSIFWDMLFIFSVTTSLGTMRLKRWSEFKP